MPLLPLKQEDNCMHDCTWFVTSWQLQLPLQVLVHICTAWWWVHLPCSLHNLSATNRIFMPGLHEKAICGLFYRFVHTHNKSSNSIHHQHVQHSRSAWFQRQARKACLRVALGHHESAWDIQSILCTQTIQHCKLEAIGAFFFFTVETQHTDLFPSTIWLAWGPEQPPISQTNRYHSNYSLSTDCDWQHSTRTHSLETRSSFYNAQTRTWYIDKTYINQLLSPSCRRL